MTTDLTKGIWLILKSDPTFAGMVSSYSPKGGSPGPAIFQRRAPSDAKMPYAILRFSSNPEDFVFIDRVVFTVDHFDQGWSTDHVMAMGKRAEILFIQSPSISGTVCLGIWRNGEDTIVEDEDDIQHLHQSFFAREGRKDLCGSP